MGTLREGMTNLIGCRLEVSLHLEHLDLPFVHADKHFGHFGARLISHSLKTNDIFSRLLKNMIMIDGTGGSKQ